MFGLLKQAKNTKIESKRLRNLHGEFPGNSLRRLSIVNIGLFSPSHHPGSQRLPIGVDLIFRMLGACRSLVGMRLDNAGDGANQNDFFPRNLRELPQ